MKKFVFTRAALLLSIAPINIAVAVEEESVDDVALSHMVVVANKSPRPIQDVVGSVVSYTANDIATNQAEDFDDILRFQPNINMESTGSRFQSSAINIRGIGGNRVAIEVDGIASTDQFDTGAFSSSGRSLPEIDLIKHVEILNGPASTLYGSDALGGVVAVTTWDPADLVSQTPGDDFYKMRVGYEGKNHSQVASGLAAWQQEKVGALLSITHRQGKGINNDDFTDLEQDTLDWDSYSLFAKATFAMAESDLLTLTLQSSKRSMDSENNAMASQVATQFSNSESITGDDEIDMTRVSLEYQFSTGLTLFEDNVFRMYYLDSETDQKTADLRTSLSPPVRIDRHFNYQQEIVGAEFNSFAQLGKHNLVMGIDFSQTTTKEQRDGATTDLLTNVVTSTLLTESFPLRDFPISKTEELGVFVQDEIELSSKWTLVPALRFDYYHLDPTSDSLYLRSNPDIDVASITETAWSPKLGVLHHFDNGITGYAQYVRGFRAAPYADANQGLNLVSGITTIKLLPNPNLESEKSDGFEIGLRQGDANSHITATLFYTRYKNFIETKVPISTEVTFSPFAIALEFQAQNVNRAEIYGFELSYKTELQNWSQKLNGLSLTTKLAVTEGNNLETDEPINSVSPAQAVINLAWQSSDDKWQLNVVNTLTKAKTRVDESNSKVSYYKPAGYGIVDFLANYQVTANSEIRFGIFNVTDKQYWNWQDVRNLGSEEVFIQSVTRPERNISLSFSQKW